MLNIRVSKGDYFAAVELSKDLKFDSNNALAIKAIKTSNINEIYSFDEILMRRME